jgi:hypothetical protein
MAATTTKHSPEVGERAVRLVQGNPGNQDQHRSRWQAVMLMSAQIGRAPRTLHERASGPRSTAASARGPRPIWPRRRRPLSVRVASSSRPTRSCAKRPHILPPLAVCRRTARRRRDGARPRVRTMIQFIEDHRTYIGNPTCRVLPITPAMLCDHLAKRVDPSRLSDHAVRDGEPKPEIERVFAAPLSVCACAKSGAGCAGKALILRAAPLHA